MGELWVRGSCELCLDEGVALDYDHCHDCGEHRGWLCRACNLALGRVEAGTIIAWWRWAFREVEYLKQCRCYRAA